jgi:formylglycine-generating enzyme required for sulfatase activity
MRGVEEIRLFLFNVSNGEAMLNNNGIRDKILSVTRLCFAILVVSIIAMGGCTVSNSQIPLTTPTPLHPTETPDPSVSQVDGMKMVFVAAGKFKMGSKFGLSDEQPLHTVYLDSFWIDKTEVTNTMYRKCFQSGVCKPPFSVMYYDDSHYADHPVEFVSWNNAKDYCSWADRRLPTEAEWEKAATWDPKTDEQRIYPWGNTFDCRKGNFDDETVLDASLMPDTAPGCDGFVRSAPVGSFPAGASPYGALDMGGNVWEWVHDAFIETDPFTSYPNYYAISPESNPQGVDPAISSYRVMRGGSWNWTFGVGRSAYRLWYGLDDPHDGVGFRCARSSP